MATIAQGLLTGVGLGLTGALGERFLARLREQVVDRALDVPLADIERGGTGDLVGRVVGDVDAVSEAVRVALPEMLVSALVIGLTVFGLAALDWRLAVAGLVAVPVQWVTTAALPAPVPARLRRRAGGGGPAGAAGPRQHGRRPGGAGLSLGPTHLRRIEGRSQEAVDLAVETSRLRAWFHSGLNLAELVGLVAILVTGFALVDDASVTVGMATAAALYFHRLFDPIGVLLSQLDTAQAAFAALARLVGVATLEPSASPTAAAAPATAAAPAGHAPAAVELAGVTFAYDDGPPVLHDVDLRIAPGERVALVGASGAGKTTIAKLVAGIHHPDRGSVRLGGAEVGAAGADPLGRAVALVSQEVHVFAGPLAADLRLARPDASDDELRAALDLVGAKAWVEALPDGLDTVVGDGGHRLAPTEAQQLALARLVLVDPAVAVLDEATAEAGSAGARRLEASAAAAVEGRTALVVAHRLTQAMAADRVVVLEAGRVVEEGTHAALLEAQGPYAALWAAWSAAR